MNPEATKRKLAAIMFTDMVGYTALMQEDEQKARGLVQRHREIMAPMIEKHRGEVIQYVGDGTFSTFGSAIEAINCAIEIQRNLLDNEEISLRIGIHVGDVVVDGDEVYGDGVNVASRLEPLAEPGGICISERIYEDIKNKPDIEAVSIGKKELKNVDHTMEVFALAGKGVVLPKGYRQHESIEGKPRLEGKRFLKPIPLFGASLVLLILTVYVFYNVFLASEEKGISDEGKAIVRASIAVLPFVNMSPDPENEYFSDGMTEELINALTKVEGLQVAARTSSFTFKGKDADIQEIGEKLKVNTVLEGSVRKSGVKLRITAQLVNVEDGYHLWSETFEREMSDVFAIQDEISRAIVDKLKIKLVGGEEASIVKRHTENLEAYNLYLKGRFYWNKRTEEGLLKSIEYFKEATERDPYYALAYAGLADSYVVLGDWGFLSPQESYLEAEKVANKALEIDGTLAEAIVSLAAVKVNYYHDWAGGERDYKRAIELNPTYPTAHQWYAEMLVFNRRFDEAFAEMKLAQELDPLSLIINAVIGWIFMWDGQYEEALEQSTKTLEMDPDFIPAHYYEAFVFELKGEYERAIEKYEEIALLRGEVVDSVVTDAGYAYAMSGDKERALIALNRLREESRQRFIPVWNIISIHIGLGEIEKALQLLEKAYEEHDRAIVFLKADPVFDPLRSDPRFKELMKKAGFEP